MTTIDPTLKAAVQTYFLALAHEKTIEPKVTAYQYKILEKMQAPINTGFGYLTGRIVWQPCDAWMMDDTNHAIYCEHMADEALSAGFKMESRNDCPLLHAQYLTHLAERNVIDTAIETIDECKPLKGKKIYGDKRTQLFELVCGWVVSCSNNLLAETLNTVSQP